MVSISDLVPDQIRTPDPTPRVVEVDDEEATEVLDALSSSTRRQAYRSLFETPSTTSDLAEELDTSIQNAAHHVSSLESVGLVEVVGHRYSENGNEMAVYGPANDPIVFVGTSERRSQIDRSLSDIVTGIGLLAGASIAIQWGSYRLFDDRQGAASAIDPASPDAAAGDGGSGLLTWLVFEAGEPGLIFFFACLLIAGIVAALLAR